MRGVPSGPGLNEMVASDANDASRAQPAGRPPPALPFVRSISATEGRELSRSFGNAAVSLRGLSQTARPPQKRKPWVRSSFSIHSYGEPA